MSKVTYFWITCTARGVSYFNFFQKEPTGGFIWRRDFFCIFSWELAGRVLFCEGSGVITPENVYFLFHGMWVAPFPFFEVIIKINTQYVRTIFTFVCCCCMVCVDKDNIMSAYYDEFVEIWRWSKKNWSFHHLAQWTSWMKFTENWKILNHLATKVLTCEGIIKDFTNDPFFASQWYIFCLSFSRAFLHSVPSFW